MPMVIGPLLQYEEKLEKIIYGDRTMNGLQKLTVKIKSRTKSCAWVQYEECRARYDTVITWPVDTTTPPPSLPKSQYYTTCALLSEEID